MESNAAVNQSSGDTSVKELKSICAEDETVMNVSESEDRVLYVERKEVIEKIDDSNFLPTPERLLKASIKTPTKGKDEGVPVTPVSGRGRKQGAHVTSVPTPERMLLRSGRKYPLQTHDISVVEEEDEDSVLIRAYGSSPPAGDARNDCVDSGMSTARLSGSSTVTKVKSVFPVNDLSRLDVPTPERLVEKRCVNVNHYCEGKTSHGSTVSNLVNKTTPGENDQHDDGVLPTPERFKGNHGMMESKNLCGSETVTKDQEAVEDLIKRSHSPSAINQSRERISNGKQLFSPGNLSSSFGLPKRLPDSPLRNDTTRRTTSTVTKERPSDALMEFTQRQVKSCLFEVEQDRVEEEIEALVEKRDQLYRYHSRGNGRRETKVKVVHDQWKEGWR